MNILLCGASGFIGQHLSSALTAAGHSVVQGVRRPQAQAGGPVTSGFQMKVDFAQDTEAGAWMNRLRGVDVVINAVGVLREQGEQTFDALHVRGPSALFEACARVGVQRVIQISALGADEEAVSAYHLSKKAADDCLVQLPVNGVVLQPSLVYGPHGASTRLFAALATLPIIPLPGRGDQLIQPVHVDDLAAAVVRLVGTKDHAGERIVVAGGEALSLRAYLATLRRAMGLGRARFVAVPKGLVARAARWGARWTGTLLDDDTWQMLERGNTGDTRTLQTVLGHAPRPPAAFIQPAEAPALRAAAALSWLLPALKLSLAFVWLASGLVSMGLYPLQDSLAMLARVGAEGELARWMLYGASAMDLTLGVLTLCWPRRRLWLAQMALVLGYTAVITFCLPDQWLHPFGPVTKNLPFLAILLLLYTLEEKR